MLTSTSCTIAVFCYMAATILSLLLLSESAVAAHRTIVTDTMLLSLTLAFYAPLQTALLREYHRLNDANPKVTV